MVSRLQPALRPRRPRWPLPAPRRTRRHQRPARHAPTSPTNEPRGLPSATPSEKAFDKQPWGRSLNGITSPGPSPGRGTGTPGWPSSRRAGRWSTRSFSTTATTPAELQHQQDQSPTVARDELLPASGNAHQQGPGRCEGHQHPRPPDHPAPTRAGAPGGHRAGQDDHERHP